MGGADRNGSRIADNRLAVTIVVGSLVAVGVLAVLFWSGSSDRLVPAYGPAPDAVPLYLLFVIVGVVLLIWSWQRVLSLFR
ncbi:hypothetical protein [Natronobacterium texcoconense]|uniref:Uncharacterized protein n=1 Tax=Natronobacterium texcoconense TaxID=1095778 RepID=A0A1H0ZAN1_NATTX|nr:hypothetical protein [Natronobacterium texcoconense]SDQ24478.1 hypothetical protein SAMN04489842_0203 [Natronobacterium texcoconense]